MRVSIIGTLQNIINVCCKITYFRIRERDSKQFRLWWFVCTGDQPSPPHYNHLQHYNHKLCHLQFKHNSIHILVYGNIYDFHDLQDSFLTHYKGRCQKKTGLCGENSQTGGGGWPKPTSWCLLTKLFLACQNDSDVLKHVLQKGGRWYLINFNT